MSESIIENYIKTEGLLEFDTITKGTAEHLLKKKGDKCQLRGYPGGDGVIDEKGKCIPKVEEKTFEETSYGQMVADAINQVVSEMPEIKLGLAVLAEQDDDELKASVQELGRTEAMNIMTAFKAKIAADLQETLDEVLREQGYTT